MSTLSKVRTRLHTLADLARAEGTLRFFKTGPGQYGEGDRFLGVTVPQIRSVVRESDALSEEEVVSLLRSKWHEERLLALLVLVRRFVKLKADGASRERIVKCYLANIGWVNNWDLVDASAPQILGTWLLDHDRAILDKLAASHSLWEQRIAVLATFAFIKAGDFSHTLALCEYFLTHPHDLMHKACGWMLREMGKKHIGTLRAFLDQFTTRMPRTMLRYAIEKLPEPERQQVLARR